MPFNLKGMSFIRLIRGAVNQIDTACQRKSRDRRPANSFAADARIPEIGLPMDRPGRSRNEIHEIVGKSTVESK